jgi:hypothetical protein
MKKTTLIFCLFLFLLTNCNTNKDGENNNNNNNDNSNAEYTNVSDEVIIDLPSSMTGSSTRANKAVTQTSIDTVNNFYNYVRYQIASSDSLAQVIKNIISALDDAEVFQAEDTFTVALTDTENDGDIVKWTVNTDGSFLLEWWKKQADDSFLKYIEMLFTEYTNGEEFLARGNIIAYIPANSNITLCDGFQRNADWVKVEFDSDYDETGKTRMKVFLTGYQVTGLDPTLSGLTATDYEKSIIEVTKNSDDDIAVVGCTYVPGTTHLTYLTTEYENRFYIYSGRGSADYATLSLAMPKDTYDYTTVLASAENSIGAVIKEYYSDYLRANYNAGSASDGLNVLSSLGYLTITGTVSNSPANPTTAAIYTAITAAYAAYPTNTDLENACYLMSVENPAYFTEAAYTSFGSTVPTGCFSAADLSSLTITQTDITGLSIGFTTAGDTPPAVD